MKANANASSDNHTVGQPPSSADTLPNNQGMQRGPETISPLHVKLPGGRKINTKDLQHNQVLYQGKWLKIKAIIDKRSGKISFKVFGKIPTRKKATLGAPEDVGEKDALQGGSSGQNENLIP